MLDFKSLPQEIKDVLLEVVASRPVEEIISFFENIHLSPTEENVVQKMEQYVAFLTTLKNHPTPPALAPLVGPEAPAQQY